MAADPRDRRGGLVADRRKAGFSRRRRRSPARRSGPSPPRDRARARRPHAHREARSSAVRSGVRPDPSAGADSHRLRSAAAVRAARAWSASRAQPRCAPRFGIAPVPRAQLCGYEPQVADDPASLIDHPALALAARWASHLQHDRRRSAHTVRAYGGTAHRLIEFLGRYRGEPIDAAALTRVEAADLRAFLADRRAGGLGAASAARELSGVRAFLNYAAEQQGVAA